MEFKSINSVEDIFDLLTNKLEDLSIPSTFKEVDNSYVYTVTLPGLDKQDVRIQHKENQLELCLTIPEEVKAFYFGRNKFLIKKTVPYDSHLDSIEATLDKGLLTLRIPKSKANVKDVEIK